MAVSQAQKLAKIKYREEKREQMTVEMPKGKREGYKAGAAKLKISLSALVQNGVEEYLKKNIGEEFVPPSVPTPENKLSADDKRLLDSAGKLTPEARKQLVKFLEILTARAATLDTSDDLDR